MNAVIEDYSVVHMNSLIRSFDNVNNLVILLGLLHFDKSSPTGFNNWLPLVSIQ